ncbi:MAG: hypothetical protein JWL60_1517 [Gemmatimonadetes bacterium]|nr:hypothetical protein [Gemmatimonadota bacterium]
MTVSVDLPHGRAVERTREALGAEGSGVLTAMDVRATFRQKLDADVRSGTSASSNGVAAHLR